MATRRLPGTRRLLHVPLVILFLLLAPLSNARAQRAPVTDTPLAIPNTVNAISGPYLAARIGLGLGADLRNHPFDIGFGGGIDTGTPLRLEATASWLAEPHQGIAADLEGRDFTMMFSGVYRFTGRTFSPYAVAGIGGHRAKYRFPSGTASEFTTEASTSLAFTFGAGVESIVSRRSSVIADVRYVTGGGIVPSYWRLNAGALLYLSP